MSKISEFRLSLPVKIILNVVGLLICFVLLGLFMQIVYSNETLTKYFATNNNIILLLTTIAIMIFMHEFFHAIPYKWYGAKVKMGFKIYAAYVMDTSRKLYSKKQMIIILLFPMIVLSLIFLGLAFIFPSAIVYLGTAIIMNISGAICDMAMSLFILLQRKKCLIKDEAYGFSVFA